MTALVVIDVQKDYFPGGRFVLFRPKAALKKVLQLRDHARKLGWPLLWIRHTTLGENARFLSPNTEGQKLHPALQPQSDEPIIDKITPNSFAGTDLESRLKALGVDTVVWTGMMSWMCVDSTVRNAHDLGFKNILARDATASGWMMGPYGLITPWSAHRAFLTALGFVHSRLETTKAILRTVEG